MKRPVFFLLIIGFLCANFSLAQAFETNATAQVVQLIREYFYNAQNVNFQGLLGKTIPQIVKDLKSRFTFYFPPNGGKKTQSHIEIGSEYKGIGIKTTWNATKQEIDILSVMMKSPAWKSGIKASDEIVQVNGTPVKLLGPRSQYDIDLRKVADLVVYRSSTHSTICFRVKNTLLHLKTVKYEFLEYKKLKIAYIQITNFSETTSKEFHGVLSTVLNEKPKGLIIDLRNNGGGVILSADDTVSFFIPPGKIFTVIHYGDRLVLPIYTDGVTPLVRLPIVLLVNGDTASSAEMFCAALHFYLKVPLIGTKTFGKSAIQGTFHIVNGGILMLVMAHAINPEGEDISGVGLKPDYVVKNSRSWDEKFSRSIWEKHLEVKISLNSKDDFQLQKALSVLTNEIAHGR